MEYADPGTTPQTEYKLSSYLFSAFKSPIHLSSSLSKKAEKILFKPSCQRREEEIKVLTGIVLILASYLCARL